MLRPLLPALVAGLCACTGPSSEPPPDSVPPTFADVQVAPSADAADPSLPLVARFQTTTCQGCPKCDLDVASLAPHVTISPPAPGAMLARLDPGTCALAVGIVGGLARDTDYTVTLGPGFRDVWGNASTEKKDVPFHTAKAVAGDTPAPRFLGSWPAEGDTRLGALTPVTLFYDVPVLPESAVVSGAEVDASADDAHAALILTPRSAWPAGPVALSVSKVTSRTRTPAADVTVNLTRPASEDRTPPTFLGAQVPSPPSSAGTSLVHWEAATDDVSPASEIRYFVYVASGARGIDFAAPTVVTEPGQTTVELAVAVPPMKVAVRAQDAAGNVDDNQIVQVQP